MISLTLLWSTFSWPDFVSDGPRREYFRVSWSVELALGRSAGGGGPSVMLLAEATLERRTDDATS